MTKESFLLDTAASDLVTMMMGVDKIIKITNPELSNRDNIRSWVLSILERDGPQSMSKLGNMTYLSKPYMTRLVDSLIEEELVERRNDPDDRRVVIILITDNGKKANKKFMDKLGESVKPFLNSLTEMELNKISSASKEVVDIFSRINDQMI